LLEQAKNEGIESLIVSTCNNRTEIYGYAEHPFQLIKLICENSQGSVEAFQKVGLSIKSRAISHMFRVELV
jgi:glutamyl-tRNA reductase